jgi:hypothetical protein
MEFYMLMHRPFQKEGACRVNQSRLRSGTQTKALQAPLIERVVACGVNEQARMTVIVRPALTRS